MTDPVSLREGRARLAGGMAIFPEGFAIELRGQVYRLVGTVPYVKRNGREITLIEWQTECPDCGTLFTMFTTATVKWARRRCDDCKAPGRRVSKGRKR